MNASTIVSSLGLLPAMVFLCVSWAGLGVLFLGIGLLRHKIQGVVVQSGWEWTNCLWCGWAILVALLQIWNLFLPIDHRAMAAAAALSILGLLLNIESVRRLGRRLTTDLRFEGMILVFLTTLVAVFATQPSLNPDSRAFHFSAVQWRKLHPLVPGLGNLDPRLSLNSAAFDYFAFLGVGPWNHREHHLGNGVLLMMVWIPVVRVCASLWRQAIEPGVRHVVAMCLMPVLVGQTLSRNLSSPAPEFAALMVELVLFLFLAQLADGERSDPTTYVTLLIEAFLMCTVAPAVHLSLAPFALAVGLIAITRPATARWRPRAVIWSVFVLIPWLAGNFWVTGYPLFPFTLWSVDIPWRIPIHLVKIMEATQRAGVRWPSGDAAVANESWYWVVPWVIYWWQGLAATLLVPALLFLGSAFLAVFSGEHTRLVPAGTQRWMLWVPPLFASVLWFLTLPDPRLNLGHTWLLAVAAVIICCPYLNPYYLLGFLGLFALGALADVRGLSAGPDFGFSHVPPKAYQVVPMASGFSLHVVPDGECWDTPVPCATSPAVAVRLLRHGDLESGFVYDASVRPVLPPAVLAPPKAVVKTVIRPSPRPVPSPRPSLRPSPTPVRKALPPLFEGEDDPRERLRPAPPVRPRIR